MEDKTPIIAISICVTVFITCMGLLIRSIVVKEKHLLKYGERVATAFENNNIPSELTLKDTEDLSHNCKLIEHTDFNIIGQFQFFNQLIHPIQDVIVPSCHHYGNIALMGRYFSFLKTFISNPQNVEILAKTLPNINFYFGGGNDIKGIIEKANKVFEKHDSLKKCVYHEIIWLLRLFLAYLLFLAHNENPKLVTKYHYDDFVYHPVFM